MGIVTTQSGQGLGYFEPSLTAVVLRGCACGTPHPQALGLASSVCPKCGTPSLPPEPPVVSRAAITGFSPGAIAARLALWGGEALSKLYRKVRP